MRKRLLRRLAVWLIPPLGWGIMWFLYLTNRKVWRFEAPVPSGPFVVLFWHGELLMAPFIFKKARPDTTVNVMISDHFDGEIITRIIAPFGLKTVRGSSRKGAAKALIGAIRKVKEGQSVGITPDGPKGPRHSVGDGAVTIAQKARIPVIVLNCRPSRYWQLKSWDRFVIPKPFGRIEYHMSAPMDLTGLEKEEARALIRERMLRHAV
ncbi:MAG: lysophospholipid acyltransferase family protein [Epsilonproteobacteria bacterium]|nr:lysophospholipid acyltransferase family protein [Campylobacterota bacterium]